VSIGPELQNLNSLVTDPALAELTVRELLLRNWDDWLVAQRGESSERSLDVVRDQLNDDIDFFREPQIPMRTDR
jgi:hypothetical protein